jgi:hypothetical protein
VPVPVLVPVLELELVPELEPVPRCEVLLLVVWPESTATAGQ